MKKNRFISILLMVMMLVTFMPSMTFADEVQSQEAAQVLMAKATVSGTSAVKLQWQNLEDATKYVVYGSQYGKKAVKIKTLDANRTSYVIKKIGKKKIVKHKVYSFYVSAYKTSSDGEVESTELIANSNTCTLISGKMMGKNNKYSNPTSIKIKNTLLKLEKEDSGKVQTLAGISSKMYKNKKHLGSKYGRKYSYLVLNEKNQLDDKVVNIDEQGVLTINEQANVGDKAKVTVQEINGVKNSFEVLVVTSEEQAPPEEKLIVIGGGGSIETDKAKEKEKLIEEFEKVYNDTLEALNNSNLVVKVQSSSVKLNATKEELADPVVTIKGILEEISSKFNEDINGAESLNDMVNISLLAKTKLVSIKNVLGDTPTHPSEKICGIIIDAIKDIKNATANSQISITTLATRQEIIKEQAIKSFKAVTVKDENGKYTLSLYFDNVDHNPTDSSNITEYIDPYNNGSWAYSGISSNVKEVKIDKSMRDYQGLTSTKEMFKDMNYAEKITGAEYLDVSNVTDMSYMFYNFGSSSTTFNSVPDVSRWDTSNVTDMTSMFEEYGHLSTALNFKLDCSKWELEKVESPWWILDNAGAKAEVWSVAIPVKAGDKVNQGHRWYFGDGKDDCYYEPYNDNSEQNYGIYFSFKLPGKQFKEVAKKDADGKYILSFYYDTANHNPTEDSSICVYLDPGYYGNWQHSSIASNVKKVVIDKSMKYYDGLTSTREMFKNMSNANEITGTAYLDVSNVTDMESMFENFGKNSTTISTMPNVSEWDVSNVESVDRLFYDYGRNSTELNFKLDLSKWDISKVTVLAGVRRMDLFNYAGEKAAIWAVLIPEKTGDTPNTQYKWYYGNGLKEDDYLQPGTHKFKFKISGKTFKALTEKDGYGNYTLSLYYDDVDHDPKSKREIDEYINPYVNGEWTFSLTKGNVKKVVIDKSMKEYEGLTNTSGMFSQMYNASEITGAEYLDVSNVTDMSYMFAGFGNDTISSAPNVKNWDTSKVTDMSSMFEGYGDDSQVLEDVPDVSRWDTSNVTDMMAMFEEYGEDSTVLNFNLNLSLWDIRKLTASFLGEISMFNYAGDNAATWSVKIPAKTDDIENTSERWYVFSDMWDAVYIVAPYGHQFEF